MESAGPVRRFDAHRARLDRRGLEGPAREASRMHERAWDRIAQVHSDCVRCGLCARKQEECGQPSPMTFGEIAEGLLALRTEDGACASIDQDVIDFSRGCLTCGMCTSRCPVEIRASKAVMAFRGAIVQSYPDVAVDYRRYRCDLDDSMFNRMREITGTAWDEALSRSLDGGVATEGAETGSASADVAATTSASATQAAQTGVPCDPRAAADPAARSLFFPGCTLGNNFPGLAQVAYDGLCEMGIVDSVTAFCCGRPLSLMGLDDERAAYDTDLVARLEAAGVAKVVTACPNCLYTFEETLESAGLSDRIELSFVTEELAAAGVRFNPTERFPYQKVSFHDSCPDRHEGRIARSLDEVFSEVEIAEVAHGGRDTVCCGSGGFASVYESDLCEKAFSTGVMDFYAARSQCLICSCANCASTYRSSGAVSSRHYLELVFDAEMDMDLYSAALGRLWDPSDPLYIGSYAADEPFFK